MSSLAAQLKKSIVIPANPVPGQEGLETLGARIREARERRGLTVREFARRLGVSPSLISQIERSLAMPSVGTLYAIANALELTFDDMFGARPLSDAPPLNFPAAGSVSVEGGSASPVQRAQDRKRIRLSGGVQWERLTPQHDEQVEFLHVVYEVGAASCPEDSLIRHPGNEYAFILSGRLGLRIGFEQYELGPGDSCSFSAQTPHRLWTVGDEVVRAIWAVVNRTT
jgi:transcriptional regulator with XRE-family HTH domain